MAQSRTYEQWKVSANKLDELQGKALWRKEPSSRYYEFCEVLAARAELTALQAQDSDCSPYVLAELLQRLAKKNFGGIANERLYSYTYVGTKDAIRDFRKAYCVAIQTFSRDQRLSVAERRRVLRLVQRSFGRTALCLSGGGSFGFLHLGVIKCLMDVGLLPHIISGSSAGAMMGALLATHTDAEMQAKFLTPNGSGYQHFKLGDETWGVWLRRLVGQGAIFDNTRSLEKLLPLLGNMTFLEAHEKTGRVFSVSLSSVHRHGGPTTLNYITSPHVVIRSAVVASCAMPFLLQPAPLLLKDPVDGSLREYQRGVKYGDGSLMQDIPYAGLQVFGANSFIVSQVNPHVMPFFWNMTGSAGQPLHRAADNRYRGGFLTSALEALLKLDMAKWLRFLGQLDLLPRLHYADMPRLFLQDFAGTITLSPPFRMSAYLYGLTDPDQTRMAE